MSRLSVLNDQLPSGVLLLDFDAADFHAVVYRLTEDFGINDDLSADVKNEIFR